jgi:two-component system phosphate regulon sensor histidine kinase PhoR
MDHFRIFILLCQAILFILLYHFYRNRAWIESKTISSTTVHEFSTISVIKIVGEVLVSEGIERNPQRLKKYAGIIKEQTSHLDLKVTRIMELALSEKQHSILEKEFVNVNDLAQQAVNLVHPLIEERRASVEFIKSDIPIEMLADSTYLTQAIVNLLDNSLKYANQPHIKLETAIVERICIISVRDNGIGMEKIF